MRTIWSGSISFGLVNIPIKLYSAINHQTMKFRLLDKRDKAPIKYKKWNPKREEEVANEDIVRAVQLSKNNFYILEGEEIQELKPEKSDYIDILEVIDKEQLDPIYFDSHYYIAPAREKDKAFFLFKEVLQLSNKLAVARFVMRDKEYTCAISSYKNGLLLNTLNYSYEIRDIGEIDELQEKPKLSKQECNLAKQLIDSLYNKNFDISKYKDTFEDKLKKRIQQKQEGKIAVVEPHKEEKEPQDLMQALKQSLRKK